jgi:Icc-related predicted phosphoesterase
VLAVSDEEDPTLTPARLAELRPALIVSCGDLPLDYLDYLVSATDAPLALVPGNHDPQLHHRRARAPVPLPLVTPPAADEVGMPGWCTSVDGRVAEFGGLTVAGLGGSLRYRAGPHRYTESEMRRRALALEARVRLRPSRPRPDLVLTHAPPAGCGEGDDPAHKGFACFHRLVIALRPRYLIHGHVHPYGVAQPDRHLGATTVVNAVPHRVLDVRIGDARR